MPDKMDVCRFIAEVKKRPTLWDVRYAEYKDRVNTPQQWQEVAEIMGVDVEQCKRKWKNLRDAYRAEVRRTQRRLERLRVVDPKVMTTSKWVYFEPMSFINESKRAKYYSPTAIVEATPTAITATAAAAVHSDGSQEGGGFNSFCDIKAEPQTTTDDDDDEEENAKLFEQFESVVTPQAVRRLSESISIANAELDAAGTTEEAAPSRTDCKCTRRADDQVHFLEDLEREEHILIQSTRHDMRRANSLSHVGDADYNFLISFLPQMKKMCELQNLQFRAKMSELVLNIISPSTTTSTLLPTSTIAMTQLQPIAITSAPMCTSTTHQQYPAIQHLQQHQFQEQLQLQQQQPSQLMQQLQQPEPEQSNTTTTTTTTNDLMDSDQIDNNDLTPISSSWP